MPNADYADVVTITDCPWGFNVRCGDKCRDQDKPVGHWNTWGRCYCVALTQQSGRAENGGDNA
jgi:hypothetical protein